MKKRYTFHDTKDDFHIAWGLFRENFKPFFIILLIGSIIYFSLIFFFQKVLLPFLLAQNIISSYSFFFRVPDFFANAVLNGFFGAAMGLAYDILASGDGFAELKHSTYYIRKYWLQFALLGLILNVVNYITVGLGLRNTLEIYILVGAISFIWSIVIAETSACLVKHGRLFAAILENFKLLKLQFFRIFITIGLFNLLFILPIHLFNIASSFLEFEAIDWNILFYWLGILAYLFYIFLGFPMFSLITIGIYHAEEFSSTNQPRYAETL